jgi:glycosyltransferase involved in cell wall biosynthesis
MELSIIIATRNRAHSIAACLDSVTAALSSASLTAAEIVVVDNGSTDDTSAVVRKWSQGIATPLRLLFEPRQGLSVAHNCALRAAKGRLLAFTDDDCLLSEDYVKDLLRHYAKDTGLVFRGGRVELGDPVDLPITIKTDPERIRLHRDMNSARRVSLCGLIHGCNMAMPRAIAERLGPFDERFGTNSVIGSGGDTDYVFRAYLAGVAIEYVPDMTVFHCHGRQQSYIGNALMREYSIANGALFAKHFFDDPNLCWPLAWDFKCAIKEMASGNNTFMPIVGFSHKDKVAYSVLGAVRYLMKAANKPMLGVWRREEKRALLEQPRKL